MYVSQKFYDCLTNITTRKIVSIPKYKHSYNCTIKFFLCLYNFSYNCKYSQI